MSLPVLVWSMSHPLTLWRQDLWPILQPAPRSQLRCFGITFKVQSCRTSLFIVYRWIHINISGMLAPNWATWYINVDVNAKILSGAGMGGEPAPGQYGQFLLWLVVLSSLDTPEKSCDHFILFFHLCSGYTGFPNAGQHLGHGSNGNVAGKYGE